MDIKQINTKTVHALKVLVYFSVTAIWIVEQVTLIIWTVNNNQSFRVKVWFSFLKFI